MSKRPTSNFILQRASAVVLIPAALWFLWSLAAHAGEDYEGARAWLGALHNRVLFGALIAVGVFHGRIGLNEIIEDYIHGALNGVLSVGVTLASLAVVALAFWGLATI